MIEALNAFLYSTILVLAHLVALTVRLADQKLSKFVRIALPIATTGMESFEPDKIARLQRLNNTKNVVLGFVLCLCTI